MLRNFYPSEAGQPIHIAYAADANYGPYAGISIASVLSRFPREWGDLHLHLVSVGIRSRDINRIAGVVKKAACRFTVYHWQPNTPDFLWRDSKYLSRVTYTKLFLADILPLSVTRVIYLDCDTLTLSDISELWRLTRNTPLLAACPDMHLKTIIPDYNREIGIPQTAPYFNAGVLVLNLYAWRQGDIRARLIEAAKRLPHCRFYDQDLLNVVLTDQVTVLPSIWNLQLSAATPIGDAGIVHFCATGKPWRLGYDGVGTKLFRNAKRNSPWRFMMPETGIARVLRRLKKSASKRFPSGRKDKI